MVAKYRLGDILKEKDFDETGKLYIVIDVADFTSTNDEAVSDNYLIEYGLYQIYPIQFTSKYHTFKQSDLILYVADGFEKANSLHRNIKKLRENCGWYDVPDFVKTLNTDMKSRNVYLTEEIIDKPKTKEKTKTYTKDNKTTFTNHPMETIDDCLDTMNFLDILHKTGLLDDEGYKKFRNEALARLKKLSC